MHEANRYLYWRQLRDMKGSALVEMMAPGTLKLYAGFCGWTLARAHARSGDAITMAAYLGKTDEFDQAITDFSNRYADQNDLDYKAFAAGHCLGSPGRGRRSVRLTRRGRARLPSLGEFRSHARRSHGVPSPRRPRRRCACAVCWSMPRPCCALCSRCTSLRGAAASPPSPAGTHGASGGVRWRLRGPGGDAQ